MLDFNFIKNSLPHAIILENASDSEAYRLASMIICQNDNSPCGVCSDCIKAKAHSHPDILTYRKGDNVEKYNIDFVRQLCELAYIVPNDGGRKIFLIYGADDLSVQCQNALLKTIEEPPMNVFFILCCSSKEYFLETILSRCVLITQNDAEADEKSLNTAIDILSCAVLEDEFSLICKFVGYKKYEDLRILCEALVQGLQKMYTMRLSPDSSDSDENLKDVVRRISISSYIKLFDVIQTFSQRVNANGNIQLICTAFCADLKRALYK